MLWWYRPDAGIHSTPIQSARTGCPLLPTLMSGLPQHAPSFQEFLVFADFPRLLVSSLLLIPSLLASPLPVARAQKPLAVPESVSFQAGIEFANPDGQHLQL